MQKKLKPSYKLLVKHINDLQIIENDFFLNSKHIVKVQVQGILVHYHQHENLMIYTLDDSTGLIESVFYYDSVEKPLLKPGDLIRVIGKLGLYKSQITIKLMSPPLKLASSDEEITWYSCVNRLWNSVYNEEEEEITENIWPGKEKGYRNERSANIYDIAKRILDSNKQVLTYNDIKYACDKGTEDMIIKLLQEGMLVCTNNEKELRNCEFEVSRLAFLPKDFLKEEFFKSDRPLKLEELMQVNGGKFMDMQNDILSGIYELMEENVIYEVEDRVYDIIVKEC